MPEDSSRRQDASVRLSTRASIHIKQSMDIFVVHTAIPRRPPPQKLPPGSSAPMAWPLPGPVE
jgi:hypothetical protein